MKPILVTGSHRSGSTWVGKMIAAAPNVGYIHEPFNVSHRPGICAARFPFWFTYVTEENENAYLAPLQDTLSFRYNIHAEVRSLRNLRDVGRAVRDLYRCAQYRRHGAVPLMKDPIALFSAEWLARKLDMTVVVVVRHPAAFASSLCRLSWNHNFSDFLIQPVLMRDHLQPFEAEIREFAQHEHAVLDQAILLWRMIHHTIRSYRFAHQEWMFLRHEDLSRNPLVQFENIYRDLNLEFSAGAQSVIERYSSAANPTRAPSGAMAKLNSRAAVKNWKEILTPAEIDRVRSAVEEIAPAFYSDQDW